MVSSQIKSKVKYHFDGTVYKIYMSMYMKFVTRRGRDGMVLDLQLPMHLLPIITNVVSSNPAQARGTRYNNM